MDLRNGVLGLVLIALLLLSDSHHPAQAQVTEKDIQRMEAQIAVIITATQANQEAIMMLDKRISLSDQDQDRVSAQVVLHADLLGEIRDEAVRTRQTLYILGVIGFIALNSKTIFALLGRVIKSSSNGQPIS